ncbi:MAG: 3-dehydroquinate synthase [Deltaproteobacteria bacterium]|nr:3-dehydroquinate synthase [Deltaproteobacteria bacterium]MBP1718977.1 3-dehydroquinate synthase [Deltaproteobacteria bacterium]
MEMNRIRVNLDRKTVNSYEIVIGRNILDRIGLIMARGNWAKRYFILSDRNVAALHGKAVHDTLANMGLDPELIEVPSGEAAKSIQTCLEVVERLIQAGADRTSALIALGGGVVGDITGFIASTYMRGIPYIQVPTTLLSQVDSSIGGKTAIDLPTGKNLMGSFHQPKAVFIDLSFLQTLPEREFKSGLAEMVKCGIIDDPALFATLESGADEIARRDMDFLEKVIARTCQIKKGMVEMDETDKGLRRYLNFGHTIGHAIEAESNYSLSHGESVSVGMLAAAFLSERMNYLPSSERERIAAMVAALGLPHLVPRGSSTEGILSRLKVDKKKSGEKVNFVLLKRLGMPFINGGVPRDLIRDVIEEMKRW